MKERGKQKANLKKDEKGTIWYEVSERKKTRKISMEQKWKKRRKKRGQLRIDQLKLSDIRKGRFGRRFSEAVGRYSRTRIKHLNHTRTKLQIAHSGEMKTAPSARV